MTRTKQLTSVALRLLSACPGAARSWPAAITPQAGVLKAKSWVADSPAHPNLRGIWCQAAFTTSAAAHQAQDFDQCRDISAVFHLVEQRGDQLDEAGVAAALAALARCAQGLGPQELSQQVHQQQAFQTLADMAAQGAGRHPPGVLAGLVSSLGSLGFSDQLVLDALSQQLMAGGVEQLGADQLRQLVEGLSAADHSPGILLLDAVSERLALLRGAGSSSGGVEEHASAIQEKLRHLGHSGDVGDQGMGLGGQQEKEQPDRAGRESDYERT